MRRVPAFTVLQKQPQRPNSILEFKLAVAAVVDDTSSSRLLEVFEHASRNGVAPAVNPFQKVRGELVSYEAPWRSRTFTKRCRFTTSEIGSRASRYEESLERGALEFLAKLLS